MTDEFTRIERAERRRNRVRGALTYVLLTFWALVVLFPFYWMILTSLKSYGAYNAEYIPQFFTLSPTLQNYADAFTAAPLGRYLVNTLIFTVITTAAMLIVITLAAYAFARFEFRGKNIVFTLFLSLMMIPNELVVITNFVTITNLDLRNTFLGLILPSITSVFYIYLLRENFAQVPDSLYYAAKNDPKTADMAKDIKTTAFPVGPVGKPVELYQVTTTVVFKYTKFPKAAQAYLQFMFDKPQMDAWIQGSSAYCCQTLKAYADNPVWTADPNHAPYAKASETLRPNGYAGPLGYSSAATMADYVLVDMFAEVVTGQRTPEEAVKRAETRINRYYRV